MAHASFSRVRHLFMWLLLGASLTPATSHAQALPDPDKPKPYVYVDHPDESESFDMILGISGGGGFDSASPQQPKCSAGFQRRLSCTATRG